MRAGRIPATRLGLRRHTRQTILAEEKQTRSVATSFLPLYGHYPFLLEPILVQREPGSILSCIKSPQRVHYSSPRKARCWSEAKSASSSASDARCAVFSFSTAPTRRANSRCNSMGGRRRYEIYVSQITCPRSLSRLSRSLAHNDCDALELVRNCSQRIIGTTAVGSAIGRAYAAAMHEDRCVRSIRGCITDESHRSRQQMTSPDRSGLQRATLFWYSDLTRHILCFEDSRDRRSVIRF